MLKLLQHKFNPTEESMEERRIVDRSGRILASGNREADAHHSDADARSPTVESKLRGYLGSVGIVVATVFFLIWAYVPNWLHSIGIHYYPLRYWVAPVPNYIVITIVVAIGVHIVLTLKDAPPPTTLKTIFDECGEELLILTGNTSTDDDEQFIGASLSDIDIN